MSSRSALFVLVLAMGCGRSTPAPGAESTPHADPHATDVVRDASSAAVDAYVLNWPTVDGTTFLTADEIAKACGAKPGSLTMNVLPLGEPTTDALGEDHPLFVGEVARAKESEHFMGIVTQVRENDANAQKLAAAFNSMYKPIAGTDLRSNRNDGNGWIRREVHGQRGRYLYSIYETDKTGAKEVCDDTELVAVIRILESRLP